LAEALADWQPSSTPLCPVLRRKTFSFVQEEKNLGLVPAHEISRWIEECYAQWKSWLDRGPRNNEELLVFVLESPHRQTLDFVQSLNSISHSVYHVPRFGVWDVHSGTLYGPPRGIFDTYLLGFGQERFWNSLMKGVGCMLA